MPTITEFRTPQLGLRPTEVGVEAAAAAGRRLGAFYNQAAEAQSAAGARVARGGQALGNVFADKIEEAKKHDERQEISRGASDFIGVISDQTNKWNDASKSTDPNDESIKGRFIEESLNPALEKFQSGFQTEGGQKWAEGKIASFREHMFTKTSADMSTRAADAVHMNVNRVVNQAINTVSNDPSSLNYLRDTVQDAIQDLVEASPNLDAGHASKIQEDITDKAHQELVHAAISSTIAKGGDWRKMADDPLNSPYIKRPELDQFEKAEKSQQQWTKIQKHQEEINNRQVMQHAADTDINKIWGDGVSFDDAGNANIKPGTVSALAKVVLKYPNAPKEVASEVQGRIAWIKKQGEEKKAAIVDDTTLTQGWLKRVDDANNPLTAAEIWQAEAEHKVTPQTGTIFRNWQKSAAESKEFKPDRDRFLTRMAPSIDASRGSGLSATPLGQVKMQQFEMDLRRKEKELGAQARSLYDPGSPNYFGKPENIAKYRVTMQDNTNYEAALEKGAPAPAPENRPTRYIPPSAVQMLKNNPSMAADFDAHYGPGQAAKILGK